MATLTLNVPDELLRGAEERLARRGGGAIEDYLLSALEALRLEAQPIDAETEAKLLQGLQSPLIEMTDADWEGLHRRCDRRHGRVVATPASRPCAAPDLDSPLPRRAATQASPLQPDRTRVLHGIRPLLPSCLRAFVVKHRAMDVLRIKDFEIANRLFVGTGKYATYELMQQALEASGCQVVTVAVRRERLIDKEGRSLLDFLDLSKYIILPNTAGCFSAEDADPRGPAGARAAGEAGATRAPAG